MNEQENDEDEKYMISCKHPVTGKRLTWYVPDLKIVDGYRSHHPVCVLKYIPENPDEKPNDNMICLDDEDWFYRILDKYNGEQVARYDRGDKWNIYKDQIVDVVILSFEGFKKISERICGDAMNKEYTFKTFIRQLNEEVFKPQENYINYMARF